MKKKLYMKTIFLVLRLYKNEAILRAILLLLFKKEEKKIVTPFIKEMFGIHVVPV